MNRDQLRQRIEAYSLEEHEEALLAEAQPAISLVATRDKQTSCPVGSSKLGGDPDLPSTVDWPVSDSCNLYFMGQVKLSELPSVAVDLGLPDRGMLYFFYDMENQPWGFDPQDSVGHRVLFHPREDQLTPRVPPESIEFDDGVLECSLEAIATLSLPSDPPDAISYGDNRADWDRYFDLFSELGGRHQLLGRPNEVQGPMELECQLASNGLYCGDSTGYQDARATSLKAGAADWRLLFQFDSDDDAGVMWGDVGMIYYWIRKQDMEACRFDKTWLVLQCS